MRRLLLFIFLLAGFTSAAIDFPPKPDPPRLVNDYTSTLTESEISRLENKLVIFNDTTSIQIAVVILKTLDGYPLSDYAFELAERWGIGQSETNNGVLLLISKEERKLYIATGYGMEGMMPDALTRRIIAENITPHFRQGSYYDGIDEGTTQIMLLAKGEYKGKGRKEDKAPFIGIGIILFILFIIFLMRVRSVRAYSSLNDIPFWLVWQLLSSGTNKHKGKWSDFSGGRGSFGGFGGGGSGGGGFGGFGGGSFGGGGAGGSW
jgi:uncharacterized protein